MKEVTEQDFLEAIRRDPEQRMRWVVLTDGQKDLLRQIYAVNQALQGRKHREKIKKIEEIEHLS